MTTITASMVKELRERTGLGMMDCKKALLEADGVIDKAIDDLRKASGLKAAKKSWPSSVRRHRFVESSSGRKFWSYG